MASKDQFSKDINFQKVVFLHVNRILMTKTNEEFIRYIKLFEITLKPYLDDGYRTGIGQKEDDVRTAESLDSSLRDKPQRLAQVRLELAEVKYGELMCLAERKGLLLEKTSSDEEWLLDEEEDKNDTEMEE